MRVYNKLPRSKWIPTLHFSLVCSSERESADLGAGMDLKGFSSCLAFLLLTRQITYNSLLSTTT